MNQHEKDSRCFVDAQQALCIAKAIFPHFFFFHLRLVAFPWRCSRGRSKNATLAWMRRVQPIGQLRVVVVVVVDVVAFLQVFFLSQSSSEPDGYVDLEEIVATCPCDGGGG